MDVLGLPLADLASLGREVVSRLRGNNPESLAFWAIVPSFLIALIFASIAAILARKRPEPSTNRWGIAVGLAIAYIVAHVFVKEWGPLARPWLESVRLWARKGGEWPFATSDVMDWLPWLVLPAIVVGLLDTFRPDPAWSRWENRLALSGLSVVLILWFKVVNGVWDGREAVAWMGGLTLSASLFWAVLDARSTRLGRSALFPWLILFAGLAVVLVRVQAFKLGLLSGSIASALGAGWLVSRWDRRMDLSRGTVPVLSVLFAGLLLNGFFLNDMPRICALLLIAAPLATFLDRIGPIARLKPWQTGLIRTVAIAIPVGAAVALAWSGE